MMLLVGFEQKLLIAYNTLIVDFIYNFPGNTPIFLSSGLLFRGDCRYSECFFLGY